MGDKHRKSRSFPWASLALSQCPSGCLSGRLPHTRSQPQETEDVVTRWPARPSSATSPLPAFVLCPPPPPGTPGPQASLSSASPGSPPDPLFTLRTPPLLSQDHLFCSSVPHRVSLTPEPPAQPGPDPQQVPRGNWSNGPGRERMLTHLSEGKVREQQGECGPRQRVKGEGGGMRWRVEQAPLE